MKSNKQRSQNHKDAVTLKDIVKNKMEDLQNKGSRSSRRPRCHRFIEQVANLTYSDAKAPKRQATKGKNGRDSGTSAAVPAQSAKCGKVNKGEKSVEKNKNTNNEVQEDKVKLKFSDLHINIGSLEVEMPIQQAGQALGPLLGLVAAAKPALK